ncbi:MAG: PhoH family protein [Alphaproteobacteria bacterium]|nr:PhoH family protein [Alphaproteobacteria bacterium]OJV46367.1 MAG: phosphate starvation-inducible protein PhoH [Alphaproteobacteria bacterium 43-37]
MVDQVTITVEFSNNRLLPFLFGEHDEFLHKLEKQFHIKVNNRGNRVQITGSPEGIHSAQSVLRHCYTRLERGLSLDALEFEAAMRIAAQSSQGLRISLDQEEIVISTHRRVISSRSLNQKKYLQALQNHELVFGVGPAGTGKTYLAVATGVAMMISGQVDRIILSRPAVEAGERLGFLPGDLREKVDPYLRPLYDALHDMLSGEQIAKRLSSGDIEVAPLAFMRGRTLANAFVILDEAQNTTPEQMKMFLTRLGNRSRMVVTGDLSQIDLPKGTKSGLQDAVDVLGKVDDIAFIYFNAQDVVRHPLVGKIVNSYDSYQPLKAKE